MVQNALELLAQVASPEEGALSRHEVPGTGRHISVWLPASYRREKDRRFPVLYFVDGDVLTSREGPGPAADAWAFSLSRQGLLPESILVAIDSGAGHNAEGQSLRDLELSLENGGPAFLSFLVQSLIPFVDGLLRTLPAPESRTLVGAGLGGLISLAGILRYPEEFGRSVGLSTSFEDLSQSLPVNAGLLTEIDNASTLPPDLRAVLYYGSHGLDECYAPYHQDLAGLLRAKGWVEERQFIIRQDPDGTHGPLSWRKQLGTALLSSCQLRP
ncbi:MAG: hypothetical protein Fur0032_19060 [Terrimicrobiaceae bacterium]